MFIEPPEVRASRGAELLDQEIPRWWERIDLESLDIESRRNCVLGQLGGPEQTEDTDGFDRVLKFLFPERVVGQCTDHGFAGSDLERAWASEITQRRVAVPVPIA